MDADHPDLFARLPLVANVDVAGRVVADQYGGEARRRLAGRDPFGDRRGDLGLHRLRQRLAVEQLRGHRASVHDDSTPSTTAGTVRPDGPNTATSTRGVAAVRCRLNSTNDAPPSRAVVIRPAAG